MTRIAALMTSYNRRELTLRCLERIESQRTDADIDVVVVDDASSDGTADAIAKHHPAVAVVHGTGDLYWVGGMRLAFAHAATRQYDHYLLVNDDTLLHENAVADLLEVADALRDGTEWPAIVVGATADPESGGTTYGGVVRRRARRPMHFDRVDPDRPGGEPRPVETMNANCVLVPREVVDRIGFFDDAFTQSFADYDYGLRARRAGCSVWLAPGFVGTCPRNPPQDALPLRDELRRLLSVKGGLAPHEWLSFARRWAGPLWPLYAMAPYVRRLGRRVIGR